MHRIHFPGLGVEEFTATHQVALSEGPELVGIVTDADLIYPAFCNVAVALKSRCMPPSEIPGYFFRFLQ